MASSSPQQPEVPPVSSGSLHTVFKMAAAEASAASRDPGGASAASRRRSRGSRNRKKAWKRMSGPEARLGREVADFLEEVALEQRTTGGLISEQPDEGLFFLDTGNGSKGKGHAPPALRPLHVDLLLQPLSKVPAPKDILAHQIPNARKLRRHREFWAKQAEKGRFPREERRLRNRIHRDKPAPSPHLEKGRSDPQRDFYDLWGAHNPLDQALVGQDPWFLQQTKKLKVKRPSRLQPLPEVPALEVIDGGGSYNPAFGEHQALLLRAHEEELKKQREELKLERQLKIPAGIPLPTAETVLQEQCEGLLEEEEEEEEEGEEEAEPREAPKGQKGKKTEQQRRREKEARALAQRQRREAAARRARQELFRLRGLRRQVALREAELRRRRALRAAARGAERARPRRVGRLRYQEPALDVQLSHELPESLRVLKPEGSILRDRFKSFQKRNMIEPRERAKFKRRYRLKYVEKRAFRAVTL